MDGANNPLGRANKQSHPSGGFFYLCLVLDEELVPEALRGSTKIVWNDFERP